MSYIDDIACTLRQAGIDPGIDAGSPVRRGWDYWQNGGALTDGRGAARTPHDFTATLPDGATWIVEPSMAPIELVAGYWRQCLIRPGDPLARSVSAVEVGEAKSDGNALHQRAVIAPDVFAVSSLAAHCTRAAQMVALVGHTPADLVLYLDHLRHTAPALFAMLLAKRFKDAVACRPRIVNDPWPATVTARWRGIEGDYLPPFLALVLYAELARLAMNQAGLLALSFDDGVELTTTQFLDRVPLASGPYGSTAITRAIEMAPFQSVALTGPDVVYENRDGDVGAAWAASAAARIALAAAETGGLPMNQPTTDGANAIAANYAVSPSFLPEPRQGHGSSRQPRPAATPWGLGWRRHAAVGLLEITLAAQQWNDQHRPAGKRLAALPKWRRVQAVATIAFGWLAEADPKAALSALTTMNGGDTGLTATTVTPLSIDAFLGGRSGDSLYELAEDQLISRPQAGELGYNARYMAHQWIDARGNDIDHYRRFQADAVTENHHALRDELPAVLTDPGRVPTEVVSILGDQNGIAPRKERPARRRRRLAMSIDPRFATLAQLEAQTVTAFSTSSILEFLRGRK